MKRLYPELTIYVSAADPLVEMEVRSYDMTPIRFGTRAYMRAFERCRYAVINGNLWDRLVKHPDQQVIQTWHGFPLKRMVNDLVDAVERQNKRNNLHHVCRNGMSCYPFQNATKLIFARHFDLILIRI